MDQVQSAEFQFDVVLDGAKAQVSETEDGDLIIEGYAADYRTDRDDEMFEPGAFSEGLKAYLDSNPVLLFHHKKSMAMGQVLKARLDQKGLWVKARLDKPEPGTLSADVFRKVSRGTIRGFSVGGKFWRRFTNSGPTKIFKADIHEISVTPQPVNPHTLFAVGQKAFEDAEETEDETADAKAISEALDRIDAVLDRAGTSRGTASGNVST